MGQHFGCTTTSYKKIGDDYKKRDATYVQAVLEGIHRSKDGCGIIEYVDETESKTNARDARVSERVDGRCINDPLHVNLYFNCIGMANGDLQSDHWVTPKSGNPMSDSWYIIVCQ